MSNTAALLTRMSTPPRLSLTHLKAVSISELLVTSHLTAYSLPVADCRDLDSSWHTISIASVSMNMFYYIASCSLMQGYQHFTCWPLLHHMSHLTVSWQTIISLQPLTHQGLFTRLHGFKFRKKAVILYPSWQCRSLSWCGWRLKILSTPYNILRRLLNVKFGGCTAVGIRIMTAYLSGLDKGSGATQ